MSQVVIGDILPYTQATAIASQTVFMTNWTADTASDVVVYKTPSGGIPNDVTQVLPYPAGYLVAFIGASQEVQVTLVTPASAGDIITITRQTPADRMNLYSNTNFTPSMLNNDFGILTLVDQQAQLVNQKIGPRYNYSAIIVDVVDTILPILTANQLWAKNTNNTAIIAVDVPGGGIAPADSTFITYTDESGDLPNSYQILAGTNVTLTPGSNTLTISVSGQTIIAGTANDLGYYATTGSVISPLPSGNNGILITGPTGVPSISSTLPSGLTIPLPVIVDANGNIELTFTTSADAVNYFDIRNDATGFGPILAAKGLDTDINIGLFPKGSGLTFFESLTSTGNMMSIGTSIGRTVLAFNSTIASRTIAFPDADGTLALTSSLPTPSALTEVSDTNVTLTLGGTPSTALLQAVSITAGWSGTLSGTRGGTGVNNGSNTATFAGNLNFASSFTTSGSFSVTQTYTGITNVTFPTSGTLATTSQIPTGAALTKTDDTNVTLTLGGSPTTALVNAASITAGWTGQLSLARGGTNASLTASNGGIFYSTATAGAILAGTATANQMLQSGSSTTPAWSTATWPATTTVNQILYSSSANTIAGLATANNGILVTSAGGVPSIGNTIGAGLTLPSITFNTTTGVVGTTTNNSAAAGSVGEYMSSTVPNSTVSLTSNTNVDATSLTLTAGDWDVWGNVAFNGAAGTLVVINIGWISTTSATLPNSEFYSTQFYSAAGTAIYAVAPASFCVPGFRVSVANATTQTVYLSVRSAFSISTTNAGGGLYARRVR